MSEIQHTSRAHARLNASSSHRWMMCPPSVKLSEQFEDKPSTYAEEGSFLHELCELKLHRYLGDMTAEAVEAQYAEHRDRPDGHGQVRRRQDDRPAGYRTYIYLNLWSDIDPTDMANRIRQAMYDADFWMLEESDKGYNQPAYDPATRTYTVQWTWVYWQEAPLGGNDHADGTAGL